MTVHLGLMLEDRGLSLQMIAWVLAVYQLTTAVFTLIGGYVGDHIPIRFATFGFSFIQSTSIIVLLLAQSTRMAFLFGICLGMGFGGRVSLTSSIRGVYFGRRAFASITGLSMALVNVLQFAAPLFAGYMFDAMGSYTVPLITLAFVSFIGACSFLLLGDPALMAPPRRSVRAD